MGATMMNTTRWISLIAVMMCTPWVYAQEAEPAAGGDDLHVIEMELEKSVPKHTAPSPSITQDAAERDNALSEFSGLGSLAPFKEVSVIQKRFMPKTERFQLFGGLTTVTNDPFFMTIGVALKGSYFFSETWGVELNYFALTTSDRQSTKEIGDLGVTTENLVYPESFYGADVMWVPIYGKMSWFNQRIIPFDLYFSGGYGSTQTQAGESAGTLHLATGQIFSLTKATAFRWDFSWNFFNAKDVTGSTSSFNNLFLTVGMSWFFPEATYR
jgi:outer membrane beta-barrel protein